MKKSILRQLIREEINDANRMEIRKKLIDFFTVVPNPNDDQIHNLAKKMNIDTHKLETEIYAIMSDLFSQGAYNSSGPQHINKEELKAGIKIEMEHTSCPLLAKRIALDHLAEIPDYYTRLIKMEKE